jgi:hypothetical protein
MTWTNAFERTDGLENGKGKNPGLMYDRVAKRFIRPGQKQFWMSL